MNSARFFNSFLASTLFLLTPLSGLSQTTLFANPINGTNPNLDTPFATGQILAEGVTSTGISRGSGINSANANDRYNATSWNTASIDLSAYFSWHIEPTPGHLISFSSFTYTAQTSGAGPTSFAFRSSLDEFAADIGTPIANGATIDLTDEVFQNVAAPIEFRLYGWGAAAGNGTFSVNDFTFTGFVSTVPEPNTCAAVFGALALVGAVLYRRRRKQV